MSIENIPPEVASALGPLTFLVYIIEKVWKMAIRGDIFARKADIPEGIITSATIHDEVKKVLEDQKVVTVDKCQKMHKEQEEKILKEFKQDLKALQSQNKMILKFLARLCKDPEQFSELIDMQGGEK